MDKWLTICIIGFVIGMFSPVVVIEYNKSQCRIEAIKAHMDADKIIQVCGK